MVRTFVLWVFAALVVNLLAGLVAFSIATDRLANRALATPLKADGVVVLTGGSGERILFAAQLYRQKAGQRLLVSGVNPKVSQADLIHMSGLNKTDMNCCVDVDVQALNTSGNARQITLWANQNNYDSLLVVTSSYHMPRALLELQKADPRLTFIAAPAHSTGTSRKHVFRRTLIEYGKYLVVLLRGLPSEAKPAS